MNTFNFTNKTTTPIQSSTKGGIRIPIYKKISTNLWHDFSNLNFPGVFKIGSAINKNECIIDSDYNITLKITRHLNTLIRGDHSVISLQEWFNTHGIDAIDISMLCRCPANYDYFKAEELKYINQIRPLFNKDIPAIPERDAIILDKRKKSKPIYVIIDPETGEVTRIDKNKEVVKVPIRTTVRNVRFT
jgi:hypothetical protein